MNKYAIITACIGVTLFLAACGDGALKRHLTLSGIYSVCRPDGYPVVCFMDADGKNGGLFCMPLSEVGGTCKGEAKPQAK